MSTKIKNLIIHCSDSEFGDVELIRAWHIERGWKDIGYNAVILNGKRTAHSTFNEIENGLLEVGRGLDFDSYISAGELGAHAMGYNSNSIGVCLIGTYKFTNKQFDVLRTFCKLWQSIIPSINILGHYEVTKFKTCPNFDMSIFRASLLNMDSVNTLHDSLHKQ